MGSILSQKEPSDKLGTIQITQTLITRAVAAEIWAGTRLGPTRRMRLPVFGIFEGPARRRSRLGSSAHRRM